METFPKCELRPFIDVAPGSVFAAFGADGQAIGLVVIKDHARSWIRFSDGVPEKSKWMVSPIDPKGNLSVLVFEGARIALSIEPNTMGAGKCTDAKLSGLAFLIDGKIAISGLIGQEQAGAFDVKDGSRALSFDSAPYFSSWSIQVPDGAMWRNIFSRSREA
jgi:hypothetical protein